MAKFSDIPQFLLTEYTSVINGLQEEVTTTNAHLRSNTIVTKGGNLIELYVDNEDDGYKKILLTFSSLDSNINNIYFFNKSNQITYDDEYEEYEYEGAYFKIYDDALTERVTIETGQNVYFRKDSLFHEWLKDGSDTIFQNRWYSDFLTKNYINTNESFIYLGKIYETSGDSYSINYENLPEMTKRMLPEHQRTDRMKEFFNLSFGNIFQEIYTRTKNLPTLIDAITIDDEWLNYIVELTNWSFIDKDVYSLAEREFVRDIVKLFKMKGTISSIYLLYKVFSNNSSNRLNIYERWHESTLTGTISASSYYDYLYLHNYISSIDSEYLDTGAGEFYYKQFLPNFEDTGTDGNSSVTIYSNSSIWTVNHDLNTFKINFQVYNSSFKRIIPKTSLISSLNTITLTFDDDVSGFCLVKSVADRKQITSGYSSVITTQTETLTGSAIDHTFDDMLINTYNYDLNNYGIYPGVIKLTSDTIETDLTSGYITIGEATEKVASGTASTEWTLTHSIGKKGLIVDVYSTGDERIMPDEIEIIDEDTIKITLSDSLSGYALLTDVGTLPGSISSVQNFDDLVLSPHYIVEIDLSTEPMDTTAILSETTSETLISYWEKIRPINNVSNYQLLFSPISDKSGEYYNLYDQSSLIYAKSKLITDQSYFEEGDSSTYYVSQITTNNKQWIINHELSTINLIVQCYNDSDEYIIPDSIVYTSSDIITINFNKIVNGTAIISISSFSSISSTDTITHSLNDDIIELTIDSAREVYESDKVTLIDDDSYTVDNILANSKVHVKSGTTKYDFTNTATWQINHNTGYKWFLSEFYNSSDEKIYPETIKIIDENSARVTFPTPVTGFAVLYFIPNFESIVDRLSGSSISISDTQDSVVTYDYITPISSYQEDNKFIYLTAEIPKTDKYTIREIGVIDSSDEVIFATICSDIVKDNNIKMIILYKISKEVL